MNNFVTLQLFKSFKKVNYYTLLIENQSHTEAYKFFEKYQNIDNLAEDLNELVEWLQIIGEEKGAKKRYFRQENDAEALPPSFVENNDLRLYVIRISEEIIVIANGGVKTAQKVQHCEELLPHFRFANKIGRQITQLITSGEIVYRGKEIINLDEIELTI